jgi:peptidoglycan/LPS O-acetylase OafA/YrhL
MSGTMSRHPTVPLRTGRPVLRGLTGVRFLAAMHVVLFHYLRFYLAGAPWLIQNIIQAGYVGVGLFFVLSGFILTYTYLDVDSSKALDRRAFWVARFARIYPLYALSLLLALPFTFQALHAHHSLPAAIAGSSQDLIATLSMLQAWTPLTAELVNGPAWSLSVEAFFYLVFPFVALPLLMLRGRRLIVAALGVWAACFVAPTLYAATNPDGAGLGFPDPAHTGLWIQALKYTPLLRLPEFLLGVIAAVVYLRIGRMGLARTGVLVSSVSGLAILALLSVSPVIPFPYLHNGLLAPLFAALIYGLAVGGGPLARLLSTPMLLVLGEASYGVYLLQRPLWNITGHFWKHFSGSDPYLGGQPLFFLVYLPILIGGSVFASYFIEKPARRWIRRVLEKPAPAVVVKEQVALRA